MVWITERWDTVKDGLKERRYVIGSLTAFVMGGADWMLAWIRGRGMTGEAFGFPSWIVGVVFAIFLIAWWLLEYAVLLRRRLAPKLDVKFGGVVITPMKEKRRITKNDGSIVEEIDEYKAVFIRGLVTAKTESAVTDCTAFLVGVRQWDQETAQFINIACTEDIQLPWSSGGSAPIAIPSGVRRYINIVDITERRQRIDPCGYWPLTMRHIFEKKTKYQLELVVSGSGISKTSTIEFTWTGDMFGIHGLQVGS